MHQGALAHISTADVLSRYLADERTSDIAASLGVHRSALNQHLLKHAHDDWIVAQAARAITAKEQAQEALDLADDALSLARAREQLKAAQWDLERVCRRIYGQNVDITSKNNEIKGERDIASIARSVAFLMRKGAESESQTIDAVQLPQDSITHNETVNSQAVDSTDV